MHNSDNYNPDVEKKWLLRWNQNSSNRVRLFCFPFAGSGAFVFRPWIALLPPEMEICAIQPPGRENRISEQPYTSMSELVPVLLRLIEPLSDLPFVFFGHSMGARVAFEVFRELRRRGKPLPFHLFLSASCAPQLGFKEIIHLQTDDEIFEKMVQYGGTPREILEDKDMLAMMIPLLRADFTLLETCDYSPEPPLACPMTIFCATEDTLNTREEVTSWQEQAAGECTIHTIQGGHLFLKEVAHRQSLLKIVSETTLSELISVQPQ